ncbi:stage II sporulation protein M [Clostridium thermarum]|uniref:stage II sporulation protein M n=1 Tax=Clostridium thermarum TaxID=1716543 RepID=UPI0013CF4FE4|nr:stage II sporulation protein M [Clostridium thermarum]
MRRLNTGSNLSRHFQESMWLYIVSLLCLFTGIVLGIYTVRYMDDLQRQDLISYFLDFNKNISTMEVKNTAVMIESLKNNLPILFVLWVAGLTIIGIPIILIVDIVKGFFFGFATTFTFYSMGYKGTWFVLLGVLPQNIIYIPCLIIASVLAMRLSFSKLKDRVNKQINYNKNYFLDYSVTFFIILLVMILGFLYEAYVTPRAIQTIATAGSVIF